MNISPDNQPSRGDFNYAGFGMRFLAILIDAIIMGFLAFFLGIKGFGYSVPMLGYRLGDPYQNGPYMVFALLYTLCFWIWKSATPGKLLLGIKIVQVNGKNLTWQKAVVRYVGYCISALPLFLGFLWILFDERKQGWHDKMAGTYVIKSK